MVCSPSQLLQLWQNLHLPKGIQIHFGPIVKAGGSNVSSKGQIIFKPRQIWMLTGHLNNEELILCQIQPTQAKSGTQDQLEDREGLGPFKFLLNFNLSALGVGDGQFSLHNGLLFLFHSSKIDRKHICQLQELTLYDLLSQFSWDWCMTRTNNESFLFLSR